MSTPSVPKVCLNCHHHAYSCDKIQVFDLILIINDGVSEFIAIKINPVVTLHNYL